MSLFSVIIPVYNRAQLIDNTLQSVFQQSFRDYEIIVVDDGSTDNSRDVLQTYAGRIVVLSQPNSGPGAARNLGVQRAQGKYLAFLDSDDLWFPWTLETYRKVILEKGEPSFITGKQYVFSSAASLSGVDNKGPLRVEEFPDYLASGDEWRWFGVSSFVIRRDVFSKNGGFDGGNVNGEDADLALRLGCADGFVHVCSPAMFGYLEHEGNITSDLKKNIEASERLIARERKGIFPGGAERAMERYSIICRHIRPCVLSAFSSGYTKDAVRLFLGTFKWNWKLRRFKFLVGALGMMIGRGVRR
ncbi:glycosyltransferase family A protein [Pontiella sulfatireligans]|uniref:Teichuronic acid biosynthesis glycosyltransferase TuaG n=1 Tax=Pontiella sulfatireligans TaxID=2750658 RepID=A0A6C2UNN1_9BACT|nr:glycosyltransferase family A protein [Pontiella sulfatireligans]VGO21669.1 Putative teichuronic acid biosynthesis glycosyltransferase TuaG [Pontiella sulfatireligans]